MSEDTARPPAALRAPVPGWFDIMTRRNGHRAELFLHGELDVAAAARFRDLLNGELNQGARRVVVDLADLEFLDAAGIAELLGAQRRTASQGGRLSIRSPQPAVRRVLALTGVLSNLQVS